MPDSTRRVFLVRGSLTVAGLLGLSAADLLATRPAGAVPLLVHPQGVLLAEASRCVACGRCELACSEWHLGRAQPSLARMRVRSGLEVGLPDRAEQGGGLGELARSQVVHDTCLQCPHPVPCALACPEGAIVADPATGARVVEAARCTGCGMCTEACPWAMPVLDAATGKAAKCDLCGGEPRCVAECPSGALRRVTWRDLTRETPVIQVGVGGRCGDCHRPTGGGR